MVLADPCLSPIELIISVFPVVVLVISGAPANNSDAGKPEGITHSEAVSLPAVFIVYLTTIKYVVFLEKMVVPYVIPVVALLIPKFTFPPTILA